MLETLLLVKSAFAILAGLSIVGMWVALIRNGSVVEATTAPKEITMHIIAELATGILLLVSGTALILGVGNAEHLWMLSMGMLIYTLVNSSGYYLQREDKMMTIMFASMFIISVILLALSLITI